MADCGLKLSDRRRYEARHRSTPCVIRGPQTIGACTFSTRGLEHLLPVSEASISNHEVIERSGHILLAFDTACLKECVARLKIRVLSNEIIRQ